MLLLLLLCDIAVNAIGRGGHFETAPWSSCVYTSLFIGTDGKQITNNIFKWMDIT